jgi:Ca-activated chloride channel family protein
MLRGVPALLVTLVTTLAIAFVAPSREAAAIIPAEDDASAGLALGVTPEGAPEAALEVDPEVVIVNGSLSAPGATGKANALRGTVASLQIPRPEAFSAERLLSQHSSGLLVQSTCSRPVCLITETIDAQLLAQPEAQYLTSLRFDSHLANTAQQRAPVNLVAVVDRSESMRDSALQLTKQGLAALVRQLTPSDQLSIVTYGGSPRTYVAPTFVNASGRQRLLRAINKLRSGEGASNLELGLSFAHRLARAAGTDFEGADRVMLFTDERPNEANFSMVLTAAERGAQVDVGLTVVGVAMPFDAQLAAALGSVRGGNLIFIRNETEVNQLFGPELHTLLSEVAHDVRINITPARGYRIAGVYGVPGAVVQYAGEQSVEVGIATAFLGSRAGQLFVTLARLAELPPRAATADEPLARVMMSYQPLTGPQPRNAILPLAIGTPAEPSRALQLGRLLIDEFTTLRRASTAYHVEGDEKAAFEHLHAFAPRMRNSRFAGLDRERQLVNSLEEQLAFLSGRADDAELVRSRISRLWGVWRVRSVQGRTDFRANERVEFTPDSKFRFFERESGRLVVTSVTNISASRQQIVMDYSGIVYNYEVRGSELVLEERPGTLVFLQRSRLD